MSNSKLTEGPDTPRKNDANGLTLRPATSADTALIASMHARSWARAYRGILPDEWLDHDLQSERAAHWRTRMQQIAAGAGHVLIAEHAGEPVGFICFDEPDESGSVYIDNLHALPAGRGLGAGTAMLAEAARWARSRGAPRLHLLVLEQNTAAIGFYESRGWKRDARLAEEMAGIDVFSLRYVLPLE